MADNVLASFMVALGFNVNQSSLGAAKKSVADYERALREAEKRIEDARWPGRRQRRRSPSSRASGTSNSLARGWSAPKRPKSASRKPPSVVRSTRLPSCPAWSGWRSPPRLQLQPSATRSPRSPDSSTTCTSRRSAAARRSRASRRCSTPSHKPEARRNRHRPQSIASRRRCATTRACASSSRISASITTYRVSTSSSPLSRP